MVKGVSGVVLIQCSMTASSSFNVSSVTKPAIGSSLDKDVASILHGTLPLSFPPGIPDQFLVGQDNNVTNRVLVCAVRRPPACKGGQALLGERGCSEVVAVVRRSLHWTLVAIILPALFIDAPCRYLTFFFLLVVVAVAYSYLATRAASHTRIGKTMSVNTVQIVRQLLPQHQSQL